MFGYEGERERGRRMKGWWRVFKVEERHKEFMVNLASDFVQKSVGQSLPAGIISFTHVFTNVALERIT